MSDNYVIKDPDRFIKAGNALFTVRNEKTGNRLTFHVKKVKDKAIWFVMHRNSQNKYVYIGTIFDRTFRLTKNSCVNIDSLAFKSFLWINEIINSGQQFGQNIVFLHVGRCGRCGKLLTVPESILAGYGPVCINFV